MNKEEWFSLEDNLMNKRKHDTEEKQVRKKITHTTFTVTILQLLSTWLAIKCIMYKGLKAWEYEEQEEAYEDGEINMVVLVQ